MVPCSNHLQTMPCRWPVLCANAQQEVAIAFSEGKGYQLRNKGSQQSRVARLLSIPMKVVWLATQHQAVRGFHRRTGKVNPNIHLSTPSTALFSKRWNRRISNRNYRNSFCSTRGKGVLRLSEPTVLTHCGIAQLSLQAIVNMHSQRSIMGEQCLTSLLLLQTCIILRRQRWKLLYVKNVQYSWSAFVSALVRLCVCASSQFSIVCHSQVFGRFFIYSISVLHYKQLSNQY